MSSLSPALPFTPTLRVPSLLTRCHNVWCWEVLHRVRRTQRKERAGEPREPEGAAKAAGKVGSPRLEKAEMGRQRNPMTLN